jgi:hypothetical protein
MTEAEWLDCTDPQNMVRFLIGSNYPRVQVVETFPDCWASDRKLRLFACACYYRIRHRIPDVRAHSAVEVAEQVADGLLLVDELQKAEAQVREHLDAMEVRWMSSQGAEDVALFSTHEALRLALAISAKEAQKAAYYAASGACLATGVIATDGVHSYSKLSAALAAEGKVQIDLLRCIVGPLPFRPVCLAPSLLEWNDGTPVKMAQAIYDERAFDHLPVLADVLEEAGYTNPDILEHCRSGGEHVRGCWVIDLLLGKK